MWSTKQRQIKRKVWKKKGGRQMTYWAKKRKKARKKEKPKASVRD